MRAVLLCTLLTTLGFVAGCGGGGTSTTSTTTTTTSSGGSTTTTSSSASNTLTISVNGGPEGNYQNGAFASATICTPGSTTNCVTIDNLLVDTGSTGLRVLDSEVSTLGLPAVNASNGSAAYDCVAFVDDDYLWGTVNSADVTLGGETAPSVPIQVISSSDTGVPTSCSNGGENTNSVSLLGANGILGVGIEPTDCYVQGTDYCSSTTNLVTGAYYTCSNAADTACTPAAITQASQVTNPVVLFPTDNNGVIVELPSATTSEASLSGSLIFGIGTESNNALPSTANIFTLSCDDFFTTVFGGQTYGITNPTTCAGPGSFIDSGSNGLFFPNATNIPLCPANSPIGDLSSYYCPTSTESLSATMQGANGTSKSVSFSVGNAEDIFSSSTTDVDNVLPQVNGTNPAGYGFDWGLPFFYGVNVYNAIDGQSVPSGQPAAPWWAY